MWGIQTRIYTTKMREQFLDDLKVLAVEVVHLRRLPERPHESNMWKMLGIVTRPDEPCGCRRRDRELGKLLPRPRRWAAAETAREMGEAVEHLQSPVSP
jgi:hypothetical protein